jgi:hypothetical protein
MGRVKKADITEIQVWDEINAYMTVSKKESDEFSHEDFMKKYGISRPVAARRMTALKDKGVFTDRFVIHGGKRIHVYKLVKK